MKAITECNRNAIWLIFFTGCLFISTSSFVAAQDSSTEMSVDGVLVTQGSIRKVSVEKNSVFLKVSKKEKISIQFTADTAFVGMKSLVELKKGQRLKVWYNLAGEENKAVKVELLLDTGC